MKRSRRAVLQAAALVGSLGVAGCSQANTTPGGNGNGNNGNGNGGTATPNNTTAGNSTATGTDTATASPTDVPVGSNERWTMLQADAANSGAVPLNHAMFPTSERNWSVQLNGQPGMQPAFDEGRVYVPTRKSMYAIDRETQEVVWRVDPAEGPVTTPVLPGDGFVYFVSGSGVHKINADGGWSALDYKFNSEISNLLSVSAPSAPVLHDGSIVYNLVIKRTSGNPSQVTRVVSMSLDGNRQWATQHPSPGRTASTPAGGFAPTPAIAGGKLYVTVGWDKQDASLYRMNAGNGGTNWRTDYTGKGWSSVSVARGLVYFADRYADVFQTGGGKVVRRTLDPPPNAYATAVGPEQAFMSSRVYEGNEGRLFAINDQGRVNWTFEGEGNLFVPTITNDTVYVTSASGALFALDKNDGLVRWRQDLGLSGKVAASGPAISTDEIFLTASGDGGDARLVSVSPTS